MFFESLAYAFGAPPGGGGGPADMFISFVPLVLMIAVFWFLLIRPQKKRQQEHKTMLESLRRGDTVVTTGGIIGRIVDIDGDILTMDLGETRVRVGRGFISGLFDAKLPAPPREKKSKSASREDKAPKKIEGPKHEEPEPDDADQKEDREEFRTDDEAPAPRRRKESKESKE